MRHIDLFTGIGGFPLAASWVWGAEHEIVAFCEIDPFCQKVLKKHWPEVPIYPDIKELKGEQFDTVELITGGFPCQPYSVAGKQQGKKDDRHLWPEMFRIIREARPRWIIAENVPGIVNMELDQVLSDLESEGYTWETFIIPACAVDAPHKRNRVWVVAYSISPENTPKLIQSFRYCKPKRRGIEIWGKVTRQANGETDTNGPSGCGKIMADPDNSPAKRQQQHGGEILSLSESKRFDLGGNNVPDPKKQGLSNGRQTGIKTGTDEKNGEMAFPGFERCGGGWWAIEPAVGRVANGIPSRVDRLKSLGNAIVPQLAAVIMQGIKEVESAV